MSRTSVLALLAAPILVLFSADAAANPRGQKKADRARRAPSASVPHRPRAAFAPIDPLAGDGIAPAVTGPVGSLVDVTPIEPSTARRPVDVDPIDPDPPGSVGHVFFTQEMLDLYLAWLGVDLDTALRYGLLDDARLISMFFDSLRVRVDRKHVDRYPVDFAPAR
ncbi:MAG TPA: hypothetical protein VFI25_11930 [Planctomycetota bacterium]|jgi:hypothetical protein|nr:hypothetical protein [Planctomycetota bacterium]